MSRIPPTQRPVEDDLEGCVGLDAQSAEERARAHGWTTVRVLPPGAITTMEYLVGRINFPVEDGKAARCWPG